MTPWRPRRGSTARSRTLAGLAALLLTVGGPVLGAAEPAPAPAPAASGGLPGYLGAARLPDSIRVLPPPPPPGSAEDQADRKVFDETRKLQGTPRWELARRDALDFFGAFTCSLGTRLSPTATPVTFQLLRRVGADAAVMTDRPKLYWKRPRPFIGGDKPICVEEQRKGLAKSFSYPSGHATFGWAEGLILAEIAPDRAGEILARARVFAESRVICGVHDVSDVLEGQVNGAALVAALNADPAFRADLDRARSEIAAARAADPARDQGGCAVEQAAEATSPWSPEPSGR